MQKAGIGLPIAIEAWLIIIRTSWIYCQSQSLESKYMVVLAWIDCDPFFSCEINYLQKIWCTIDGKEHITYLTSQLVRKFQREKSKNIASYKYNR